MKPKAVVLLSGGLDSATILAMALEQGFECYALTLDYQQRNHVEIQYAIKIAKAFNVTQHRITRSDLAQWGGSALTDHTLAVPDKSSTDIPITYVPARNTIFLSLALSWAEVLGARDIFFGANRVDGPNYPDCRPEYFAAFERMANLATRAGVEGDTVKIHTPIVDMNKVEIIREGLRLGVDYDLTLSCYDPTAQGQACDRCDPCRFREIAFEAIKNQQSMD